MGLEKSFSGRPGRSFGLAFIFLLALGLRLAVYFQSKGIPQVETPVLDSRYYLEAGQAEASGIGLGPRPYFMSPGYIGLSALFHRLFENPRKAIILFQIFIDSFTCVLAALLTFRLFGLFAGMIAGALLAMNAFQILSTTRILPETTAAFLMAALALLLVRSEKIPRFRSFFFSGALFGLLTLFRSNSLLMLPFLGLALWVGDHSSRRAFAKRFSFFLLGAVAAILPVTLRNLIVGKDLVFITSSGGVNFYLGNAIEGDGRFISLNQLPLAPGGFDDDPTANRFEHSIQAYAENKEGRALKPSEVSSFWMGLALKEIAQVPGAWLKLVFRKLFLFFNSFEIPQVDNLYFLSPYIPLFDGPLAHLSRVLWPLALFGFVVLLFSDRKSATLLLIFAGYLLSVVFFFVTARHRLPILPLAACFAGFGVVRLYDLLRQWNCRKTLPALGLFIACAGATNLNPALGRHSGESFGDWGKNWFGVDAEYLDFASQHNNMAALLLERGDAAEAEKECRKGLALKPHHSILLYNLARSLEAQGRVAEAKSAAFQSWRNGPDNPAVAAFLGDLYYKTGDFVGARGALETAVRLSPYNAEAWNTLGPTLYRLGDSTGAIAALRRAEVLAPGWFQPRYNRGIMLSRMGRYDEATRLLDSLHHQSPENREVSRALAEALIGVRQFKEAGHLLTDLLAKNSGDAGTSLLLAELQLKQGKPKEARILVLQALGINPKNPRALQLLQACDRLEKQKGTGR